MVAVADAARVVDQMPDAHLFGPGSQAVDNRADGRVEVERALVDQRPCACGNKLLGDRSDIEDGVRAQGLSVSALATPDTSTSAMTPALTIAVT